MIILRPFFNTIAVVFAFVLVCDRGADAQINFDNGNPLLGVWPSDEATNSVRCRNAARGHA